MILFKFKAFSLAETLIALGIIGIVSALIIPNLIAKHQHKALETAFKKTYTNLNNAVNEVIAEDSGIYKTSNFSDRTFYNEVFAKYTVIKTIPQWEYLSNIKVSNYNKKSIKGAIPTQSQIVINIVLSDGSAIGGRINSMGYYFTVDTNGPQKGPNAFGHDIFIFIIKDYSNPKLEGVSEEMVHKTDENGNQVTDQSDYFYAEKDECSKHSTKFSNGYGCTPFAIKNICPDDSSKTYWECLP